MKLATDLSRPWLSVRDASTLTGLSQQFIRRGCQSGRFASIKVGTKTMVNATALLETLDAESRS